MSVSKITSSQSRIGGDENFPDNNQDNDIEDRYVKEQCTHDTCHRKSVKIDDPEIHPEIPEEVAEEEYIGLGELNEEDGRDETLGTCDFTDAECGEPMRSQFLRLDFTPIDGVDDNPHIQKKCSDIWQFICSQPQLQGIMVVPERGYEEVFAKSSSETSLKKCKNIQIPAVEWLKTGVGHKMAFAAKHQSKYCDHHNGDYMDETLPQRREATLHRKSADRENVKKSASTRLKHAVPEKRRYSTSNAVDLCTQLEKWDRRHPKSLDPPGRVPNLTHAILQRCKQER